MNDVTADKQGLAQHAGRYLTFALSEERYGLKILAVHEIIGMMRITRVPRTNPYLLGVINLRGKIIPVVDLRLKFGLPSVKADSKTCTIVVEVTSGGRPIQVGIVVDTVLEVLNLEGSQLEPAPDYGSDLRTEFVLGMGRTTDKHVIILVDIERALSDATMIREIADGAASGAI